MGVATRPVIFAREGMEQSMDEFRSGPVLLRPPCMRFLRIIATSAVCLAMSCQPGFAYRPFDGTDAAVAKEGEMEIEFQPAGALRENSRTTVIAPATRLNFGLTKEWEAVLEGQMETPISPTGPSSLSATGAFLKGVLLPGSLQDKSGISIATEFGALLPEINGDPRWGLSLAGIASQRWDWGAVHFNLGTALTRAHRGELFVGTIVEGPAKWAVRPVAEVFYDQEFGISRTVSGLVGLIWQLRDDVALDVGLRHAVTNGHALNEVRAGVTFAIPMSRSLAMKAAR
jgi:hypothetical protein